MPSSDSPASCSSAATAAASSSPTMYSSVRLQVERQTASPSSRASAAARRQVERHPLAQLDRCDVVRQADERERHVKWLPASASRATITSTKPPSARYAARRPVGRETRNAAVDEPGQERHHLERVERAAVAALADDAGGQAERQERQRDGDRAPRQPLERRERRQAQPQDVGRAALQPALLPEVEPGQTRGEREAGERGEHETDVQDEEEVAVVGAARRRRCRRRPARRRRAPPPAASPPDRAAGSAAGSPRSGTRRRRARRRG